MLSIYWASGTFLTCLQVMVIILVGVAETVHGEMSLGTFLAFVSYNSSLAWPVRSLGRVLADMSKAGVSIDRVGYILQAPEETDLPEADIREVTGDIVFDHVTFGYGEQEVLKDVSFTIPQGTTFAILGGTGAGKSTLVHLLDRLYDLEDGQGRITIGGHDLRLFQRDHLRKHIGLVLQEPFLYSRSIRDNLAITRPDASQDEIDRVARVTESDGFIREFEAGYDTLVGERGVTLSGGQKQRIAIARTLLRDNDILILDDSLSAVDTETDRAIRQALKDMRGQGGHVPTTFIISHRVTTLADADRILVLEDGRITQQGTHEELIAVEGLYRRVYRIQAALEDELDQELSQKGGEDLAAAAGD